MFVAGYKGGMFVVNTTTIKCNNRLNIWIDNKQEIFVKFIGTQIFFRQLEIQTTTNIWRPDNKNIILTAFSM